MAATSIGVPALTAAGFAALKGGDVQAARNHFEQAVVTGDADSAVWFGLSIVHRSMGESAKEDAALDRVLSLDPHHLPSLIAKGDLFARLGDRRAADSYYAAALKLGANLPSLSPEWQAELRRVETLSQGFARDYEAHLLGALGAAGLGRAGTERFSHAIDLMLGKRKIFLQQPQAFYYPELPQIQFFDRRLFPWIDAVEREFDAIRHEALAVMQADVGFVPYVRRDADRPAFDVRGLLDNPSWSAFYLIQDGSIVEKNAAVCPRTLAALSAIPLCRIENRTPSALFSLLRPGARIPPHHGFMNARVIGHLPLIVPPNCALRVGNETRVWREGEVVLFDDTIEHEAWNASSEPRLVLIFDVWRPELNAEERELVSAMLRAIDTFGGPRRRWTA
jgi:aspartyl/asparaginyl beta-hydroxylase (cupin superfamily)